MRQFQNDLSTTSWPWRCRRRVQRVHDLAARTAAAEIAVAALAAAAFRGVESFLARFPDDPTYSPDAMFRLGELYFERSQQRAEAAGRLEQPGGEAQSGVGRFAVLGVLRGAHEEPGMQRPHDERTLAREVETAEREWWHTIEAVSKDGDEETRRPVAAPKIKRARIAPHPL